MSAATRALVWTILDMDMMAMTVMVARKKINFTRRGKTVSKEQTNKECSIAPGYERSDKVKD